MSDIFTLGFLLFVLVFAIGTVVKCETTSQRVNFDMWQKPIELCKLNGGLDNFDIEGDSYRTVKVNCKNGAGFKYRENKIAGS